MEFNKINCLQLLFEKIKLEEKGQIFREVESVKNDQLIGYFGLIEDQIYWLDREKYLIILNSLLQKKLFFQTFF